MTYTIETDSLTARELRRLAGDRFKTLADARRAIGRARRVLRVREPVDIVRSDGKLYRRF